MSKEIVKKETTALAQFDYGQDAETGARATGDDLKIPLLYILQPMSPQLREHKSLKMGHLWNNVTEEAVESVEGVIVGIQRTWVEQTGKASGKVEFVARHDDNSPFVLNAIASRKSKFGKIPMPDGNTLEESVCLFMVHPDMSFSGLVIKLSGLDSYKKLMTKLTHWQNARAAITGSKPPSYATRVKISTSEKEFTEGHAYIPVFTAVDTDLTTSQIGTDSELYQFAKAMAVMINAGKASAVESVKAESSEDNCLA